MHESSHVGAMLLHTSPGTVHAEGKADDATYTLLLRANLCENHKHVAFDWIKQGYILNPTKCIATEQLDAIEFVDLDEMAQAIIDASLVEFSNVLVQQPYCIDAASTGLPWRMSMMDHLDLFAVTRSFVTNRSATSMYAAWRDVVSVRRVLSTMLNTAVAQGTPHALRARAKCVGGADPVVASSHSVFTLCHCVDACE